MLFPSVPLCSHRSELVMSVLFHGLHRVTGWGVRLTSHLGVQAEEWRTTSRVDGSTRWHCGWGEGWQSKVSQLEAVAQQGVTAQPVVTSERLSKHLFFAEAFPCKMKGKPNPALRTATNIRWLRHRGFLWDLRPSSTDSSWWQTDTRRWHKRVQRGHWFTYCM